MTDSRTILLSQFEAALAMLRSCIDECPELHWDSLIAKYPFWMVAYHTLCFVDCYLAPDNDAWCPHPEFHPRGRAELDDEYPSRRFLRRELQDYAALCLARVRLVLGGVPPSPSILPPTDAPTVDSATPETAATLDGPSGFSHLSFSRAELHLYNIRHIQHHTGQLTASLRRVGVDTKWVKAGGR